MVSNQRPSRFLRLVWRGVKQQDCDPPSKGVVIPTDCRIRRKVSSTKHPELEPGLASPSSSSSASTSTTTGSVDDFQTGRTSSAKAVRFQLDEHQNIQCQVHVYESSTSAEVGGNVEDDNNDDGASAATTTWLSREELRRQKRLAIGEARTYARDHPEYVRALELLFNSPVNPRPGVGTTSTELEALQVIGTSPVRGLEGYCTPVLFRHKQWATQTILHVHGQLRRRRNHDGRGVSDDCDGDTPFEADGESSMSSPSPLSIDNDDDEDKDDDDENLRLLRRCCEFVNRGPCELAVTIGAADAWAAANVHRESTKT